MTTFEWISIIIAIAVPLSGIIFGLIRWIMKLNKKLDAIMTSLNLIAKDVCDIHTAQGVMLVSQKTTLEALTGNINGNIEKATTKINEAEKIWNKTITRNMDHTCEA